MTDEVIEEYYLYGEDRTFLPKYFERCAADIENFEVRNDDIIVASFPKSGTTWAQEMVWLIKNKLDYKGAEARLVRRFPLLEMTGIYNPENKIQELNHRCIVNSINYVNELKSPRFIKTHLPFSLLPREIRNGTKTPKIIYVMRNPKDVSISYFHMGNTMLGWRVSEENFTKAFLADKVLYAPYWKNVLGFCEKKHSENLFIIKYEDMHNDLKSVIRQVCVFLEEEPLNEEQLEILSHHLSFESMKSNEAVNKKYVLNLRKERDPTIQGNFIRSGKVGEHKNVMSSDILSKFHVWTQQNILNTDFAQKYSSYC